MPEGEGNYLSFLELSPGDATSRGKYDWLLRGSYGQLGEPARGIEPPTC
jgi:hypothetical protein